MLINGKEMAFDGNVTVAYVLKALDLDSSKVVVEVDFEIISKDSYDTLELSSDSKVEIIRFVGGG